MCLRICIAKKADGIECAFSELLESGPEVVEWEYVNHSWPDRGTGVDLRLEEWLNNYGLDGWELVQMDPSKAGGWRRAIFKRRRRTEPDQGKCCECGG